MDSIKRGICESYELKYDDWKDVSPIICNIINRIIEDNKTDTNFGYEKYLFDTPFLYPKDIEMMNTSDTIVIFIGYAYISVEDEINEIRLNDKEHYWTSKISDEELRRWTYDNIEFSKYLESECNRLGIKYYDTSKNRDQVLKEALDYILNK